MSETPQKPEKPENPENPQDPPSPPASSMIGLAYELIGFFAAPPLVGYFLDTKVFEFTGGRPGVFVFLGLFLGFAGGGWYLYRRLARMGDSSGSAVGSKSAITSKEESVEHKAERIARELDEVGRRIDGAVESSRYMESRGGDESPATGAGPDASEGSR